MTETVTLQQEYPYPPDQVFQAWTDVALLSQWFGCAADMLWTVHEWDVRPGGAIRVSLSFDTGPFEVEGQFLVVEPPHRLRYQWSDSQIVDVLIERTTGGSRLTPCRGYSPTAHGRRGRGGAGGASGERRRQAEHPGHLG